MSCKKTCTCTCGLVRFHTPSPCAVIHKRAGYHGREGLPSEEQKVQAPCPAPQSRETAPGSKFSQGLTLKSNKQQSWHTGETETLLLKILCTTWLDLCPRRGGSLTSARSYKELHWLGVTEGACWGQGWRTTFRDRQCACSVMGKLCASSLTFSPAHLSTFFWGSSSREPHVVDEKTERMSADCVEHGFSISV